MPILSPYQYVWSIGNSSYKIDSFTKAQTVLKANHLTAAFLISDGRSGIYDAFEAAIPDIKQFTDNGGKLTLELEGANVRLIIFHLILSNLLRDHIYRKP